MVNESKVEYLIVDTSVFIKNVALQDIGNTIITEPGVVNEITSKRQLRRLVVLPYDLEVKEAFPEDIKFVTDFSKKTGDYASLSATDIKVIALTYRYEREQVGTSHLKQEPEVKKVVVDSSVKNPENQSKIIPVGFYMPEGDENDGVGDDDDNDDDDDDDDCEDSENEEFESESDDGIENENIEPEKKENSNVDKLVETFKGNLNINPEDLKLDRDDLTVDDILKPVKDSATKVHSSKDIQDDNEDKEKEEEEKGEEHDSEDDDSEVNEDEEDDGEDDGWITPKNVNDLKKKMDSGVVKEKPAKVACLTMDYAMQNVLMHIGLNVASLQGKVIKEMRTFLLRCYSCFKTTGLITKIFCPHCGNKTLKKVAVSMNDEGKQIIHINYKKRLSVKGKKFSLPTYQGGKHACNPLLFEDQPMPDQRPTKIGRAINDPLHEDYTAGYSPFVMRDVNSRAAMLNIKSGNPIKHWMRRNPNEVRKHKK